MCYTNRSLKKVRIWGVFFSKLLCAMFNYLSTKGDRIYSYKIFLENCLYKLRRHAWHISNTFTSDYIYSWVINLISVVNYFELTLALPLFTLFCSLNLFLFTSVASYNFIIILVYQKCHHCMEKLLYCLILATIVKDTPWNWIFNFRYSHQFRDVIYIYTGIHLPWRNAARLEKHLLPTDIGNCLSQLMLFTCLFHYFDSLNLFLSKLHIY